MRSSSFPSRVERGIFRATSEFISRWPGRFSLSGVPGEGGGWRAAKQKSKARVLRRAVPSVSNFKLQFFFADPWSIESLDKIAPHRFERRVPRTQLPCTRRFHLHEWASRQPREPPRNFRLAHGPVGPNHQNIFSAEMLPPFPPTAFCPPHAVPFQRPGQRRRFARCLARQYICRVSRHNLARCHSSRRAEILRLARSGCCAVGMTPARDCGGTRQIYVGQAAAKRARGRGAAEPRAAGRSCRRKWRKTFCRKNILMIGPTGVGRRNCAAARRGLAGMPIREVEASKYTEVGYVGRDSNRWCAILSRLRFDMVREEKWMKLLTRANRRRRTRAGFAFAAATTASPRHAGQRSGQPARDESEVARKIPRSTARRKARRAHDGPRSARSGRCRSFEIIFQPGRREMDVI